MIEINGLRPDINALEVPALAELLGGQAELYPYHGIYEKLEDDVLFIIHSSGSTGMSAACTSEQTRSTNSNRVT